MRWAIVPEKLDAMLEVLEARALLGRPFTAPELEARMVGVARPAFHAAANVKASDSKRGKVAILPLTGIIAPKSSMVNGESLPQGTGCDAFGAAFDRAMADDSISAVVIDVDSPGGSVDGVPELAAKIYGARGKKPIMAIANSMACSAAYFIASAADEICVVPSGEVGSIGVFCIHEDDSGMFAEMGIKHTIIKAGEYKAEGNPFEPLSDDARAYLQSQIDEFYSMFVNAVAMQRGVTALEVRNGFGQGRSVLAKAAVKEGMADRIATFDQVLAKYGVSAGAYTAARNAAAAESGELQIAAESTDTTIGMVAGGAAPAILTLTRVSQPAPKGQEHTVPDPEKATAALSGAPNNSPDVRLEERRRASEIRKLCSEHLDLRRVDDAKFADDLIERGVSVDQAKAQILDVKRAEVTRGPQIRAGHDRSLDQPWKNFGEQLTAVHAAYSHGGVDKRLAAASGMNQAVPSEGGFSVAPQFAQTIWDGLAADPNGICNMTDCYTVEGESLTFMANAETSRVAGSRWGGVRGYWIAEADQITKSTPKLRTVKVEPQQMAVLVYVTEKLLRNSPIALEQFVSRAAISEIGFLTGDAIIEGTGAGQPRGILGAPATVVVAKETSQPNTTFNKQNANKMWARLHPNSQSRAVWLYNVDVSPQFDEFNTPIKNVAGSENVGGIGTQIYNAEKNTLKGRPLIPCEFCSTLGTVGDVILADMQGYLCGIRGGIDTQISMHVRFEYAEQAFRFIYEVDGQPWLAAPLTPFKGANTLSTFVTLASRP